MSKLVPEEIGRCDIVDRTLSGGLNGIISVNASGCEERGRREWNHIQRCLGYELLLRSRPIPSVSIRYDESPSRELVNVGVLLGRGLRPGAPNCGISGLKNNGLV